MPAKKEPAIVLVRPRNPGNIGSAARVMANFGFSDLRVVAPYPPKWEEALKLAADSKSLLSQAKVCLTLPEALEDRTKVYGTSSLQGRIAGLPVRQLPGLRLAPGCAILFGSENNGLVEDDLQYCDELLRISTDKKRPTLNLAQAVAIVCYETTRGAVSGASASTSSSKAAATRGAVGKSTGGRDLIPSRGVERLVEEGERAFRRIRYRPKMTPAARRMRLRKILRKRGVSREEAGLLSEVLRRVLDY